MPFKEDLQKRKEINFRKRAARGEKFHGCAEANKQIKEQNKQNKIRKLAQAALPLKEFKASHNDMNYEEYDRALKKGLTLEDVLKAPDKRILSGPTKETMPKDTYKRLLQRVRLYGLDTKREDCKNDQMLTYQNPTGGGRGSTNVSHKHTAEVFALADRMQGIDLSAIPGMYDTKYGPQIKLQAVITWLLTGNLSKTEKVLDLPRGIVAKWKTTSDWWPMLAKSIQIERGVELDAELTTLISTTSSTIKDRLEDGDYKYNSKLDKLVRVPVQAKEAAIIMDKAISNRNLLRGDPTSRTETVSVLENLSLLKQEFKKFAEAKTIEGEHETIDTDD